MKPTHAQLVNLLREIVCASPQVQPWLIERARQVLCLRDAAPATPAVTGEADRGSWPSGYIGRAFVAGASWWQFFKHGSTPFPAERDEMEAEAVRRYGDPAAPPAAGAPPALDEKIGDVDCHGCGGAGRVLPSLREELTEIIRWRFKTADGAPMNGPLVLKRAQEIANEIAPHIEEAVGER